MGTTDLLGSYGKYQYFSEDGPEELYDTGGGMQSGLVFENESARARLVGPDNSMLQKQQAVHVDFLVHRDRSANAAVIEIQGRKLLLKPGEMSVWVKLNFTLATPWFVPDQGVPGICRFFLQEVSPNFRLYVSPINIDPSAPVVKISEPESFIQDVSKELGLFYTTGFQEDYNARKDAVFDDEEFARQANLVLEERLALFDYAVDDYEDGLLFFYFSSSDLQSHIFWWDSEDPHPVREAAEAKKYFDHVRRLYQRLDAVIGELMDRYGSNATLILMSDHGFANFGRQFNVNSWLRAVGYLGPPECTSLFGDVDWSMTAAYALGINGLYVNLKGRERDGFIESHEKPALLTELAAALENVRDFDGSTVIRKVYRAEEVYQGQETKFAPDLIIGYARGYRASWATMLGDLTDEVLLDNNSAWSADHCADAAEVPGILFTNRPIAHSSPSLVDIAPSILAEFGLNAPAAMTGKSIY
jgi:predicted AlkP superfamily phosphohydrolase/phosphomutase